MEKLSLKLPALLMLLSLLAGCAGLKPPHEGHLDAADSELRDCAQLYAHLDAVIGRAGVRDVGARRVEGYPYLRNDRFGASFNVAVLQDERLREAWLARMHRLDASGREFEIANLPASALESFGQPDRAALLARTRDCAERLAREDRSVERADAELAERARVADDYSNGLRVVGLYELTRIPFHAGVRAWQERASETIAAARQGAPPGAPLRRYRPPEAAGYSRNEVAELLARAAEQPLGIAELTRRERDRLFATYAPAFEIESGGDYDRIGRLAWNADGLPVVDSANPTVYRRLDYTRLGERTLLQLVYTAWFSERPPEHAFDLLAGRLDGLAWRVTLAPDGSPVLYDTIHPCGCYHQFFPTPRVEVIPAPEDAGEWAFVPATLPLIAEQERVVVSLQTRSHYLRDVYPSDAVTGKVYRFADYDSLRAMPLPDGGSRSLFGADGLVAGSERGERFLFWPMGISSAGAMRQAGSQATAFVGRRHFDDADLIEKRFRLLD